uniref:Cytochrome P450 n=1 Tax=Leersia perrieri TaxID=77586 RepID=A0A0D9XZ08_9ORYZ
MADLECCSYMLPLLTCCLFFIYTICYMITTSSRTSDDHLAPKSYPVIGCLVDFYRNRRRLLAWYTSLLAASPSQTIVVDRLGARRTVVTANPANVEHILKSNFVNYPKGKPFTDVLGDLLGGGIFNVDGDAWYAQRKLVSHEFSARVIRDTVGVALEREAAATLVPALDAASAGDGGMAVVDMQELLRQFAFNVVCRVALGGDGEMALAPLPLARLASAVIHDAVMVFVRRRRRNNNLASASGGGGLVARMSAAGYGDEAIRDAVVSFIMAGRDTTSSALTWFFWLMSRHRDVEAQILLDSSSSGATVLLHAALCETMRLYPPVAWDSKHAADDDTLPDGTRVRRGDRVTYFPYGMGRMESIWGTDAGEFRPARWMTSSSSPASEGVSPFKWPVFQGGPRTCLGKEMAFVQMKFVAAAVLRRFELRPVAAAEGSPPPEFVPLLTAHMAGGLKVTVRRRSQRRQNGTCGR